MTAILKFLKEKKEEVVFRISDRYANNQLRFKNSLLRYHFLKTFSVITKI